MPFRNAVTTTINTATTSHVVTLPTYKKNDIVVMAGTFFGAAGAPTNAGWELLTSGILTGTLAYYGHYRRKMDGTEGSTVTLTSPSSIDSVWAVASYKDVGEKDAVVTTAVLTGTGSLAAVAGTTAQDNEDVIQLVSANGGSSGSAATPPTGYTERAEVWTGSFSNTSEISDIAQATHGSTGTPTMTITNGGFLRTVITTITLTNLTYFGNANSGGATRTLSADTDYAQMFQCTKTGKITKATAVLTGGGAGSTNVRFIVYNGQQLNDSDPSGFSKLGSSDTVVIGSSDTVATIEIPFTTPVDVVNGTWYALGVQVDNTVIIDCSGSGAFYNGADTFSDGAAATYPSGGSQSGANRRISVQAGVEVPLGVYTESATISTVTTPSSSELYAITETGTISSITSPSAVESADYIDAQTIATLSAIIPEDVLYTDVGTIPTFTTITTGETGLETLDSNTISVITTLIPSEFHQIFESATISTRTTLSGAEYYYVDSAVIRTVTVLIPAEFQSSAYGSWGPYDDDNGDIPPGH